jgi:hypothetical protein
MEQYSINAETLARLCRNFTGISSYTYYLYIQSNQYSLIITEDNTSFLYITIPENQFQLVDVGIKLSPELIEFLKTYPLKKLSGDLTFSLENEQINVYFDNELRYTFSDESETVVTYSTVVESNRELAHTFTYDYWNQLLEFLDYRKVLDSIHLSTGIVGTSTIPVQFYFKNFDGLSKIFLTVSHCKLIYDCYSKLKLSQNFMDIYIYDVISELYTSPVAILEFMATLKLSDKTLVDFKCVYVNAKKDVDLAKYLEIKTTIEKLGTSVEFTEEKVSRALNIFKDKGYTPTSLCTLTKDTKLPLSLFTELFSDVSNLESVYVLSNKLLIKFRGNKPDVCLTLYLQSTQYQGKIEDTSQGTFEE